MHARLLDVLHDPADDAVAGVVAQRVDVDLDCVLEEPVDERGPLRGEAAFAAERAGVGELPHRAPQVGVVVHDLHRAPTEHVRRAHEHRVADVASDCDGRIDFGRGAARRAAGCRGGRTAR